MQKRFGSVALEKIVPASLNGSASLVIDNGALEYRLLIPAEQLRSAIAFCDRDKRRLQRNFHPGSAV